MGSAPNEQISVASPAPGRGQINGWDVRGGALRPPLSCWGSGDDEGGSAHLSPVTDCSQLAGGSV